MSAVSAATATSRRTSQCSFARKNNITLCDKTIFKNENSKDQLLSIVVKYGEAKIL